MMIIHQVQVVPMRGIFIPSVSRHLADFRSAAVAANSVCPPSDVCVCVKRDAGDM